MLEAVEEAIQNDEMTYEEFILSLAEFFEEETKDLDDSTEEERIEATEKICTKVIDKYGRKKE